MRIWIVGFQHLPVHLSPPRFSAFFASPEIKYSTCSSFYFSCSSYIKASLHFFRSHQSYLDNLADILCSSILWFITNSFQSFWFSVIFHAKKLLLLSYQFSQSLWVYLAALDIAFGTADVNLGAIYGSLWWWTVVLSPLSWYTRCKIRL